MRKLTHNYYQTLGAVVLGSTMMMSCSADSEPAKADEALEPWQQAEKTEVWEPVPPVIDSPANGVPSDAIVLLGENGLSEWEAEKGGKPAWEVSDGVATVARKQGGIRTKQEFCDIQLHVEWKSPTDIEGMDGQNRGNSGIFLQERYEIQVLDSYDNETYPNGQAGSVYKQSIPLANATREPGEWQAYDIIYTAPRFDESGELESPGYVTVLHNGVLVQNHFEIQGATAWIGEPSYEAHGCAPLALQDHDAAVSFRNIWVREL
ncbi:3-keto-disaccharide hydrolase [Marinimicrobium sp. ARAG 43.8]|uniref:3-keto-disaccharide hydrolase n=1 Tax=Marinimicrobium sp. ARAG 43.8 TaxID=3418719 RepID=UPI003CF0CCE2